MAASRVPTTQLISWPAVAVQLAVLVGLVVLVHFALGREWWAAMSNGALLFLAASFGSRWLVARDQRLGMRSVRQGDFAEAIPHFERSHAFFERHRWADTTRALVLLTSSAVSYREMALVNVAFCHAQSGRGDQAIAAYRKALADFPDSVIAQSALRMAKTFGDTSSSPAAPGPPHG